MIVTVSGRRAQTGPTADLGEVGSVLGHNDHGATTGFGKMPSTLRNARDSMTGFTTALDTTDNALERVGGKGRSLSCLANAGFAVPGGFQVTADAYRRFVSEHALQTRILELARPVPRNGGPSFDGAADAIGSLFADHALSEAMAGEIRSAYDALPGRPAVAVRSSANAEDLPGLSFAGQQETFLNVRGADAVVRAVMDCWASLWTTQAISYRHQNGIDPDSVAMAVVVQIMVPSEVSGILFTANPATGERGEMIVNASFGLGEAVVGGQVTPDTYIVDRTTLAGQGNRDRSQGAADRLGRRPRRATRRRSRGGAQAFVAVGRHAPRTGRDRAQHRTAVRRRAPGHRVGVLRRQTAPVAVPADYQPAGAADRTGVDSEATGEVSKPAPNRGEHAGSQSVRCSRSFT